VLDLAAAHLLALDADADLHRGAPRRVDGRAHGHEVADEHGMEEVHTVDPGGHDATAGVADRGDPRHLVA